MVNDTYKKKDFNLIRLLEKNKSEFLFVLVKFYFNAKTWSSKTLATFLKLP